MDSLNKVLSKINFKKKSRKVNLLKELKNNPERFVLEAFIENDEINIKIKKKIESV